MFATWTLIGPSTPEYLGLLQFLGCVLHMLLDPETSHAPISNDINNRLSCRSSNFQMRYNIYDATLELLRGSSQEECA
jgi:hypothetical protein